MAADARDGKRWAGREPVQRGRLAEALAAGWLRARGLQILDHNLRAGGGEIDLLARDGRTLVFVEVRLRRRGSWVGAAASISRTKRDRLRACARALLARRRDLIWPGRRLRFDVVSIEWNEDGLELRHLRQVRL